MFVFIYQVDNLSQLRAVSLQRTEEQCGVKAPGSLGVVVLAKSEQAEKSKPQRPIGMCSGEVPTVTSS